MGTSFIEYRGFGFWSRDSDIESWITSVLERITSLTTIEPWQMSLAEHWRVQAGIDGGCVSLELDKYLNDSAKRDFVIGRAEIALLSTTGPPRRTGELFIALLAERLKTTASSPIDYL